MSACSSPLTPLSSVFLINEVYSFYVYLSNLVLLLLIISLAEFILGMSNPSEMNELLASDRQLICLRWINCRWIVWPNLWEMNQLKTNLAGFISTHFIRLEDKSSPKINLAADNAPLVKIGHLVPILSGQPPIQLAVTGNSKDSMNTSALKFDS